jgi:TRAP-type mannitol/chloroaromatic compound transport system substrate-binding protein
VNDLRQPLSSIAAIAYYIEMTLPAEQLQALHYLQHLQELVDQTNSILEHAASLQNEAVAFDPSRAARLGTV